MAEKTTHSFMTQDGHLRSPLMHNQPSFRLPHSLLEPLWQPLFGSEFAIYVKPDRRPNNPDEAFATEKHQLSSITEEVLLTQQKTYQTHLPHVRIPTSESPESFQLLENPANRFHRKRQLLYSVDEEGSSTESKSKRTQILHHRKTRR
ncbi:hypothetical protein G4B88_005626 [Cannabis sativa]|uniref:Uncharacterized protein n=1 Tax=Cannabis sativa TaxID=3483 RepID=A0A7J6HB02_CANSA|nr:hypothetical protein G4B88_005626 [Cannabis sativa]